ncbi:hypothetical protein LTR94_002221 [Friedmanniomyces endolithicus]|nr:hypothetical protein LTR94_002221 [Friedmanniomyces endolithicus]
MVTRAVVAGVDDSKTMQSLQVDLLDDETQDAVEHFQPYGFTAHPRPGAEAVALSVGGLRGHTLLLGVADRRYRITGLQEGEVAIHDDQGQFVLLGRDGIRVVSPQGVSIETDGDFSVEAGGAVSIKGAGETLIDGASILLGEGASLNAARKTDTVSTTAITGGSSKVKIA